MEESLPCVSLAFRLQGPRFDPADVTTRVGIEPTFAFMAGDQIGISGAQRRASIWAIRIGPAYRVDVPAMLEELMGILLPFKEKLNAARKALGLRAVISCTVEPTSRLMPILNFNPEIVQTAAKYGAEIDVDLLAWAPDEPASPKP